MTEWIFERPDGFESDAKHDAFCKGELVRCKDCKHRIGEAHNVRCKKFYGMGGYDDYCSYGERKDNE